MQPLLAIALLTWKAAFRFRLFLVLAVLLLLSVVGLPLLIKDDGTARGFTQILLTYTLGAISALLGLSTLWLACGTLARDIEECQMQMVVVKPVARWQIWLGKWLGIVSLNAALLALSGACVFALLQWRATKLPLAQQEVLRNEVLVARGSARERSFTRDIEAKTDKAFAAWKEKHLNASKPEQTEVRNALHEQVKASYQVVLPGYQSRPWEIRIGAASRDLRGEPLFLRVKFNAADDGPSGTTYQGAFRIGVPKKSRLWQSPVESMSPDTFHEFKIPPDLFDDNGVLTVTFANPNETALLFPLDEGVEVLYRQGGFTLNFIRGLGIILCWMALLTTVGLTSASFLSFPVAAFFALGLLGIVFSSGTMSSAVEEGTIASWDAEKGTKGSAFLDVAVIPTFRAILKVIHLAEDFSPIDSLSSGRSITWTQLGLAVAQIVLFLGGAIGLIGIVHLHPARNGYRPRHLREPAAQKSSCSACSPPRCPVRRLVVQIAATATATRWNSPGSSRWKTPRRSWPSPPSPSAAFAASSRISSGFGPWICRTTTSTSRWPNSPIGSPSSSRTTCRSGSSQAWNMAYNISVKFTDFPDRWRWVKPASSCCATRACATTRTKS